MMEELQKAINDIKEFVRINKTTLNEDQNQQLKVLTYLLHFYYIKKDDEFYNMVSEMIEHFLVKYGIA